MLIYAHQQVNERSPERIVTFSCSLRVKWKWISVTLQPRTVSDFLVALQQSSRTSCHLPLLLSKVIANAIDYCWLTSPRIVGDSAKARDIRLSWSSAPIALDPKKRIGNLKVSLWGGCTPPPSSQNYFPALQIVSSSSKAPKRQAQAIRYLRDWVQVWVHTGGINN